MTGPDQPQEPEQGGGRGGSRPYNPDGDATQVVSADELRAAAEGIPPAAAPMPPGPDQGWVPGQPAYDPPPPAATSEPAAPPPAEVPPSSEGDLAAERLSDETPAAEPMSMDDSAPDPGPGPYDSETTMVVPDLTKTTHSPPPAYPGYGQAPAAYPPPSYSPPAPSYQDYQPASGPMPTTAYPAPPPSAQPSGYSYQQDRGTAYPAPGGYQPGVYQGPAEEPPAPTPRVVLPKAPSRVEANLLAGLVGLILAFGGLALAILVLPNVFSGASETARKILAIVFVIVVVLLPVLLAMWGPMAALVPGVVFTALAIWLAFFADAPSQLADVIGRSGEARAFMSYFGAVSVTADQPAVTTGTSAGLVSGVAMIFAGIAAIVIRRRSRRAVQDAFDAEHAAAEMQPVPTRDPMLNRDPMPR